MQQRRLRLGDILDDYCPRERRITNHVIVAMIGDDVQQTRCATCEADHEYREGKLPAARKKKIAETTPPRLSALTSKPVQAPVPDGDAPLATESKTSTVQEAGNAQPAETESVETSEDPRPTIDDEGPVHRRLIRATLPRPEGQIPERREPDFTVRQPDDRGNSGNRPPGQRSNRGRRGRGQQGGDNAFRFGAERGGNRSGSNWGSGGRQKARGPSDVADQRGQGQGRKRER